MLTSEDKKFLTENFATKKELMAMRDGFDLLRKNTVVSSLEKFNFKSEIDSIQASNIRIEEKIDKLMNIADGNAGNIADLQQENKMGAITLRRHDVQIHELATATSTTISE
jgi:hypothetical protein